MSLDFKIQRHAESRALELGGGEHPLVVPACQGGPDVAVDVQICHDEGGKPTVDFQMDMEKTPWPLRDSEFDLLISRFSLEHCSCRAIPNVLTECFRVLKSGGGIVLITPDTEAQLRWIFNHPNGWDGNDFFQSASRKLFGDQTDSTNCHKSYFNHITMTRLLQQAGFEMILVQPFGLRDTDLVVEARKPILMEGK